MKKKLTRKELRKNNKVEDRSCRKLRRSIMKIHLEKEFDMGIGKLMRDSDDGLRATFKTLKPNPLRRGLTPHIHPRHLRSKGA